MLLAIVLTGVAINLLPFVRDWVASVEARAAAAHATTATTTATTETNKNGESAEHVGNCGETQALLSERSKKHQKYLDEGLGPKLNRYASVRAGPTLGKRGNN